MRQNATSRELESAAVQAGALSERKHPGTGAGRGSTGLPPVDDTRDDACVGQRR
ncbi:hypothetical protein trd_A0755 (plasmid) [Thermomicrobium roseum DSM 5159]|uniref:Uncharacterized protein n=1 Tax=Thermomicrobium roseum (strain ATCC 27502 / DSM 5159 / P-2) TaxID=309801 RepID=B9L4P1_THERP|nr:hypothetical protein trd_A0755 [Thermomicrobium roseum DSM 5159]